MRKTVGALAVLLAASLAHADFKDVPHPYMLWTKDEAAAIRKRYETDPVAKLQFERMVQKCPKGAATMINLFRAGVLGDQRAAEAEKGALLRFIGKLPPPSKAGNPASGNTTWRDDRTFDALRFDVVYDLLTPEERQQVLDSIRAYADWFKENPGCQGSRVAARTGWLPNMQWPTIGGLHVLAAASKDQKIIEQVFNTPRGFKWYFDKYLADGFYMEEFAKYPSNVGHILLWCEGLHRLGLDQYGYGYTSPSGTNVKQYLQMLMRAGFPRLDRPDGAADYLAVTMGDAGHMWVQTGPGAADSSSWWHSPMMWGGPKMLQPLWWEIGHRRFPDAGFDYFLARLRKPGDEAYLPSLFFGLGPISPKNTKGPAVSSYATTERGFAMLRMEESPAYWDSPRPAAALQFGMYYVHYVHDCFALLHYVAYNREIYTRMGVVQGGYAGGDPWRDHVRGQAGGIVVDGLQAKFVDGGEQGIKNQRLRQKFSADAKFVAIRAQGIYPDVDMERSLVLTDQYLLDLSWLVSDKPRVYDWHVLAPATHKGGEGWKALEESPAKERAATKLHLSGVQVMQAGAKPWTASLLQDHLPRGIGVKVSMLSGPDTVVLTGNPPGVSGAGVKLLATRTTPATLFAVLHEAFENNTPKLTAFERLEETDKGLAAKVEGPNHSDRILLRFGNEHDKPLTLGGGGESFTFSGYCFIRVGKDDVTVTGDLQAMKLQVPGQRILIVNGQQRAATFAQGMLTFP